MYKRIITAAFLLSCFLSFSQGNGRVTISQPGDQVTIGERTLNFTDRSRNRPIITEVWYPTIDTVNLIDQVFSPFTRKYTVHNGKLPSVKLPLILLSHGTGGGRLSLEWLAQDLAQKGFIVAAVDHWGDTMDNMVPVEILKPWERPQDISFALTALLDDHEFNEVIDPRKIGAIGFSFGGNTVIELAGATADYPYMITYYKTIGHKEIEFPEFPGMAKYLDDTALMYGSKHLPILKDDRIKAFFAISPGLGPGYHSENQVRNISRPVYIIGAGSDSMAPVKTNALHYHRLIRGSGYFQFGGKTGHYVMLSEANQGVSKKYPTYFLDDPTVDRHLVHLKVDSLAINFFEKNL